MSDVMQEFKDLRRELMEYIAKIEAERDAAQADSRRLDWLLHSGALMAYSKDGDDCWLHWPYGDPSDEESESRNQKLIFSDTRAAIDAAMNAEKEPPRG